MSNVSIFLTQRGISSQATNITKSQPTLHNPKPVQQTSTQQTIPQSASKPVQVPVEQKTTTVITSKPVHTPKKVQIDIDIAVNSRAFTEYPIERAIQHVEPEDIAFSFRQSGYIEMPQGSTRIAGRDVRGINDSYTPSCVPKAEGGNPKMLFNYIENQGGNAVVLYDPEMNVSVILFNTNDSGTGTSGIYL